MDKDLEQLRAEIDGLDQQIVELFKARMEAAGEVAGYKKEHGLPVLDAGRERTLLNKIAQQAGEELGDYAQSVYRTLLSNSYMCGSFLSVSFFISLRPALLHSRNLR